MAVHLYFSMIPEALIASMLSPEEFGVYYATGTKKKSRGQAIFVEVDPSFRHEYFQIDEGIRRCVPHEDGSPKRSIYISVYRVLEHLNLKALQKLYLATSDGRVLGLDPKWECPADTLGLHLYKELVPVTPLVVSSLGPCAFHDLIGKNPTTLLTLPAVAFVELQLGELALDPEFGAVGNLPYSNIDHLRECLLDLKTKTVNSKMVDRANPATFPYRTIKGGFYVGNYEDLIWFPMPSQDDLRANHYGWWRSANM